MPKITLPPSEALYPVPVVLVSSGNKDKANIITIARCGVVCSKPPTLSISIRPSRHSHRLIKETGDFVINIPSKNLLEKTDLCGIRSGKDADKFKLCSFTAAPSSRIVSPMIKECPVNIECVLKDTISLGSHDMFIGEVLACHVDTFVLGKSGRIDFDKAKPVVYNQGEYWDLAKRIGTYGFAGK